MSFLIYKKSKKRNPDDWCIPEGTKINQNEKVICLPNHHDNSVCIQAPYSLHQSKFKF